jgi:hypothetical protein
MIAGLIGDSASANDADSSTQFRVEYLLQDYNQRTQCEEIHLQSR